MKRKEEVGRNVFVLVKGRVWPKQKKPLRLLIPLTLQTVSANHKRLGEKGCWLSSLSEWNKENCTKYLSLGPVKKPLLQIACLHKGRQPGPREGRKEGGDIGKRTIEKSSSSNSSCNYTAPRQPEQLSMKTAILPEIGEAFAFSGPKMSHATRS